MVFLFLPGVLLLDIIGSFNQEAQAGEKKFYNIVVKLADEFDSYFCYYQPQIIDNKPDFMIFGPDIGLLIIEIKDYEPQIQTVVSSGPWISSKNGSDMRNPFDQLQSYIDEITFSSTGEPTLVDLGTFVRCVVVFPKISEDSTIGYEIDRHCPKDFILFYQDDLISSFSHFLEVFKKKIDTPFGLSAIQLLNMQARCVKGITVPKLRQTRFGEFLSTKTDIELLDEEQRKMARQLGDGHRIIFGVAGSGKTVILIARAKFLALKYPNWKILILCFNKVLSNYLSKILKVSNYPTITVSHYHKLTIKKIKSGDDAISSEFKELEAKYDKYNSDFYNNQIPKLFMKKITSEPDFTFDAILIDEGQDFSELFYESIVKILNPATNSLLIAYDGLQGIYDKKKIVWSHVNIDARGRTIHLKKSYRNPKTIGEFAVNFLQKQSEIADDISSDEDLNPPEGFIREGGEVIYFNEPYIWDNRKELLKYIEKFLQEKLTILILFRSKLAHSANKIDKLIDLFNQKNMDYKILKDWNLDKPGINISTIHSAKGLEADVVIIPDIDDFMLEYGTNEKNRKLIYVAMTRATKYLVISSREDVIWTQEIEDILHYKRKELIKGRCIKCGVRINYDKALHIVRCFNCYVDNKSGPVKGKYCHLCKKEVPTTLQKPLCLDCYKKRSLGL